LGPAPPPLLHPARASTAKMKMAHERNMISR
jgi:hypothetical protein